ncbi:hypoxanthine phosphoribosyltransferase [bacterium]|nr:hypoxanthine phosphoribosyltransferase [bacterium]MBU1638752.1 hypoxanthine phosphoribosyltransferase [bacterium]MBU1921121.1 hypoxanthine phosphoribosyltransferase [bacterium]
MVNEESLLNSTEIVGEPPYQFVKYLDRSVIREHVRALAARMANDFRDKNPVFVGVLRGCFVFMADLVREVNIPCEIDFIKISSYGNGMRAGRIEMKKEVGVDLRDRHVILVDDIVDTGNSWDFLRNHLLEKRPASVTMASMFRKPEAIQSNIPVDYVGMDLPNEFVVGYGLDHAGQWRQLPDLYILKNE